MIELNENRKMMKLQLNGINFRENLQQKKLKIAAILAEKSQGKMKVKSQNEKCPLCPKMPLMNKPYIISRQI